ncbi:MAG: RNB domain-containing ribonuclease [Dermatophilaceae bacterium]
MPTSVISYRRDVPEVATPGPAAATTAAAGSGALLRRFDDIRARLGVPDGFPEDVLAEAGRVAESAPRPLRDETGVPFWTLDPLGSLDLDQAMALQRAGEGYRVRYAIADVPAFVRPDGAIDAEARRRGQTIYLPDRRAPLHPAALSEGAASLLPSQDRPAYVWDLALDASGQVRATQVYRALVRSHDRLDYTAVQRALDAGSGDERFVLLREIGQARQALELARGGASLPMPEQQVHEQADGSFVTAFRPPLAAEDWNAQISLMTGMAAAEQMIRAGVGILRTMPAPDPGAVDRFRRQAKALGVPWPTGQRYGQFLRSLDRTDPRQLALIHEATALFRGAGYTPFDGAAPAQAQHAAVAAPYAHVTAPLRRLVDRFALVVCEAVSSGAPVPQWARSALPMLPQIMAESDRRASAVDRACTDAVEAATLSPHVGARLTGTVVDVNRQGSAVVQLADPAVLSAAAGSARPGDPVTVLVQSADVAAGTVSLRICPAGATGQR